MAISRSALAKLQKAKRILITTHILPDGDGLGSEMALHRYFKSKKKTSRIINTHATPPKFLFIDPKAEIQVFEPGKKLPPVDLIVIVDTHDWKMLGPLADALKATKTPILFIDHHIHEKTERGSETYLIDPNSGSTGELIFGVLKKLGALIDSSLALPLYVSIVTDTVNFTLSHTTAQTHRIAAELLKTGISCEPVYRSIYGQDSLEKMRFLGHVLEKMKTSDQGKVAWITATREMRDHYAASVEDSESFVNYLTLLDGVEIGLFFREEDDGRIKVSFRSYGAHSVYELAKRFGGGGHANAAGVRINGNLDEVVERVVDAVRRLLQSSQKGIQRLI